MPVTFKSKLGLELVIPLVLALGAALYSTLARDFHWIEVSIQILVISFVIHLFMTTYYVIDGEHLTIKAGFLINKTIDIHDITKISETNNPISAPATSIDRLKINYGSRGFVLISPKHKKAFIESLTQINPKIELKYKMRKA